MEDHRGRLCVIVAGYTGEMRRFLDSNPGLRSRFTRAIASPITSGRTGGDLSRSGGGRRFRLSAAAETTLADACATWCVPGPHLRQRPRHANHVGAHPRGAGRTRHAPPRPDPDVLLTIEAADIDEAVSAGRGMTMSA